jgi:hypothetical protein
MTLLVSLNKLINSQIINIDSFNRIIKVIPNLEYFLLLEKVAVLRPFGEQNVRPVFGLHVIHLLHELVRHPSRQEDFCSQPHLLGFFDRIFVNNVLDRQLLEKLLVSLVLC